MCPSEQTAGTIVRPLQIQSRQVAILQAFESKFGTESRIQCFIKHSLAGGGSHNLGCRALRWKIIPSLHGNAGEMGKYAVFSVLPDKLLVFLYEYHYLSYTSLGLPAIPLDRSNISVHCNLRPDKIRYIFILCTICRI